MTRCRSQTQKCHWRRPCSSISRNYDTRNAWHNHGIIESRNRGITESRNHKSGNHEITTSSQHGTMESSKRGITKATELQNKFKLYCSQTK